MDASLDGTWSAEVPLVVGENTLTATASYLAGTSPSSAPVVVARWEPRWTVRGQWPVHPVTLYLDRPSRRPDPADKAVLVVTDAAGTEVARHEMTWVSGFYLVILRDLQPGSYHLSAELLVNGHLITITGPALE